jgi:hypothetical protein
MHIRGLPGSSGLSAGENISCASAERSSHQIHQREFMVIHVLWLWELPRNQEGGLQVCHQRKRPVPDAGHPLPRVRRSARCVGLLCMQELQGFQPLQGIPSSHPQALAFHQRRPRQLHHLPPLTLQAAVHRTRLRTTHLCNRLPHQSTQASQDRRQPEATSHRPGHPEARFLRQPMHAPRRMHRVVFWRRLAAAH